MILGIHPFHPDCPVCWHIVVHNIFLQSFVFLWCQLLFLLIHFWLYLFVSSLFFLIILVKVLSIFFIFQKTSSWIHQSSVSIFRFYFIYAFTDLYYFPLSLGFFLLFFFQVPLSVKLDCLFEIFLVTWGTGLEVGL